MECYDNSSTLEAINQEWQRTELARLLGIRIRRLSDESAEGEMPLGEDKGNGNREIQGGAYFTFADNMAGVLAWNWAQRHLGSGFSCVTVSSSFHFLRAARNCNVAICKASSRRSGHNFMVVDASVCTENGTELCCGTFHMYFIQSARYKNACFSVVDQGSLE